MAVKARLSQIMKNQKANWTPLELNEKYLRWEELTHETEAHYDDCLCDLCLECFGLNKQMEMFSEDEHVSAVIEYRKSLEEKL